MYFNMRIQWFKIKEVLFYLCLRLRCLVTQRRCVYSLVQRSAGPERFLSTSFPSAGGSWCSEFGLQSADESDDHISVFLSVTEGACGQIKHVLRHCCSPPHCCCIWKGHNSAKVLQSLTRVPVLRPNCLFFFCGIFFCLPCRSSTTSFLSNSEIESRVIIRCGS